jgi:hypothetical protein
VGNFGFNTSPVILGSGTVIAQTNPIQVSGLYYINATAFLFIDVSDVAAYCYVTVASSGGSDGVQGGSGVPGTIQQASIADAWIVSAGDVVELVCESSTRDPNTYALNASLTATLINSGFDAKKLEHSHPLVSNDPRVRR